MSCRVIVCVKAVLPHLLQAPSLKVCCFHKELKSSRIRYLTHCFGERVRSAAHDSAIWPKEVAVTCACRVGVRVLGFRV